MAVSLDKDHKICWQLDINSVDIHLQFQMYLSFNNQTEINPTPEVTKCPTGKYFNPRLNKCMKVVEPGQ
jgi:hypothetical protein